MWKLSDETIMEYVMARHSSRRRFELTKVEEIEQNLHADGWIIEDRPKSTVLRPRRFPGHQSIPPISVHFDEEA